MSQNRVKHPLGKAKTQNQVLRPYGDELRRERGDVALNLDDNPAQSPQNATMPIANCGKTTMPNNT